MLGRLRTIEGGKPTLAAAKTNGLFGAGYGLAGIERQNAEAFFTHLRRPVFSPNAVIE